MQMLSRHIEQYQGPGTVESHAVGTTGLGEP